MNITKESEDLSKPKWGEVIKDPNDVYFGMINFIDYSKEWSKYSMPNLSPLWMLDQNTKQFKDFQKYCKDNGYNSPYKENLKDKLKTTPSAGLTFIGKSFNIKKLWTIMTKIF